jgi:hypothetical protein
MMNSSTVSRYVSVKLNRRGAGREILPAEWDNVTIDNRRCFGCFGSELAGKTAALGTIGATDLERLNCWIDLPVDDCGRCACRIYCGSRVEFPGDRPGEVFEAVARIDTTRNRCQRWSLKPLCGPCD